MLKNLRFSYLAVLNINVEREERCTNGSNLPGNESELFIPFSGPLPSPLSLTFCKSFSSVRIPVIERLSSKYTNSSKKVRGYFYDFSVLRQHLCTTNSLFSNIFMSNTRCAVLAAKRNLSFLKQFQLVFCVTFCHALCTNSHTLILHPQSSEWCQCGWYNTLSFWIIAWSTAVHSFFKLPVYS